MNDTWYDMGLDADMDWMYNYKGKKNGVEGEKIMHNTFYEKMPEDFIKAVVTIMSYYQNEDCDDDCSQCPHSLAEIRCGDPAESEDKKMTREEIIAGLKFTVEMFLFDPSTGETITEPRNDMDKTTIDACKGAIELLEQEPKTGHWIITYPHGKQNPIYECPRCHASNSSVFKNFCPNCGYYMVEPQESEE